MIQLAIRCQPRVPASADELQHWLERQVDELRAEAPHATVRLSRLTQGGPSTDLELLPRLEGPARVVSIERGDGSQLAIGICAGAEARAVTRLGGFPGGELDIGWLFELELDEDEPLLAGHRLADALRDMRLLGLQPTLLAPPGAWMNGRAA